ncbi:hypothetical protein GCM10025774_09350 [Microbacterium kyungheense]
MVGAVARVGAVAGVGVVGRRRHRGVVVGGVVVTGVVVPGMIVGGVRGVVGKRRGGGTAVVVVVAVRVGHEVLLIDGTIPLYPLGV